MEQTAIEGLRDRLTELRQGVDDLQGRSGDFPALYRNLERVRASLQMAAVALGGATPDLQGDI